MNRFVAYIYEHLVKIGVNNCPTKAAFIATCEYRPQAVQCLRVQFFVKKIHVICLFRKLAALCILPPVLDLVVL
jgi:hypothetical protein